MPQKVVGDTNGKKARCLDASLLRFSEGSQGYFSCIKRFYYYVKKIAFVGLMQRSHSYDTAAHVVYFAVVNVTFQGRQINCCRLPTVQT